MGHKWHCGPFKCDRCDKRFKHEHDCEHHKLTHTNKKRRGGIWSRYSLGCDTCGRRFPSEPRLQNHQCIDHDIFSKTEDGLTCKLCQKVLHVKSYGIGEYPFPEHLCINKETNTITCLRCREEFKSRKLYKLHICNRTKEHGMNGTSSRKRTLSKAKLEQLESEEREKLRKWNQLPKCHKDWKQEQHEQQNEQPLLLPVALRTAPNTVPRKR